MLLYLHVPFCRRKCEYCAFYSVVPDMDAFEVFGRAVELEARYWGEKLGRPRLTSLYVGGGTPSMMPPWLVQRVLRAVRDNFDLDRRAEVSFEANPDSVDTGLLGELHDLGVNRLSLGVQSLNDEELKALGRPHTRSQAIAAVDMARMAGFRNLNLDFIWGVPGQRLAGWLKQLRFVCDELGPGHLSCYSLTVEEGTPLAEKEAEGGFSPPGDREQARIFVKGAEYLEERGYLHYEISNFARMGFVCRHNLGYWEGKDYLGMGPSAVSTIKGARWEHPRDVAAWAEQAEKGMLGSEAERLDRETRVRELVMLSLRTSRGLDLKRYKKVSGRNFVREHNALLTVLRQHELVRITKDYVRLTKNGMLVSNAILEKILYNDEEEE
ncbi:radical SAM family heme chaperone HemW [Desulfohalovibrio reitneri]|uniref:radical SAM family heme chaperone HemW n=1 Tax=Desulfohalovibrio reitneri TaxID=1307759 RepID=UPI0004A6D957|nr:radical SAM family heme chaperone HemW [Desulfohalovibrio reitneri]